jgi:hypothetical protein
MMRRLWPFPPMSDHGSEIVLLSIMTTGVLLLIWRAIELGKLEGLDVAAFLLILQRITEAVQKRWEQRSIDQMSTSLANAPPAQPPAPNGAENEEGIDK